MGASGMSLSGSHVSDVPLLSGWATDRRVTEFLHVSPTHYSPESVVGGGEKYVIYMCRAIQTAAPALNMAVRNKVLAPGDRQRTFPVAPQVSCELIPGREWDPYSLSPELLREKLAPADVVVIHQCFSPFGMFVAAHAALLNKKTVGLDHGGGEHPLVYRTTNMGRLFGMFHAYSKFGALAFEGFSTPVNIVSGPVDTEYYSYQPAVARERDLVLSVGRLLPHKGFDRIIRSLPSDLRLVIIGSGYDVEYREYLRALSVGKDVRIVEGLSDAEVLNTMRRAGLYVHASSHHDYRGNFYAKPELLGLAPLEAMSTGAPAFVSNAGSLPELSSVAGCEVFRNDDHLAEMLNVHAAGLFDFPPAHVIASEVERLYGLRAFGEAFLRGASRNLR